MKDKKSVELKRIASKFFVKGLLVQKDAMDILLSKSLLTNKIDNVIDSIVEIVNKEEVKFVETRHVFEIINNLETTEEKLKSSTTQTGFAFEAKSKNIDEDMKVLFESVKEIGLQDEIERHREYFLNRYSSIAMILRKRFDMSGTIALSQTRSLIDGAKARLIVIVSERKNTTLYVEDPTGHGKIYLSKKADKQLQNKFEHIMPDIVIGLWVSKYKDSLFCEDIIYPDVSDIPPRSTKQQIAAILTSDLHIGSKFFLEKSFLNFSKWLKGEIGDKASLELASKVKYLLIAGDVVDGIGIYPRQDKELKIKTSIGQYEKAAELLSQIPDYIKIIIIPGNHDFTRKALPQPPISAEESKPILNLGNVSLLANPSLISLHGVVFQMFHGQSLEDLTSLIPNVRHDEPHLSMEYLIKVRHLAPYYGGKTQIQTSGLDNLVIFEKPDVFHAGHVHVFGARIYRGVSIVNSATWQDTTPYQEMMGVKPTPGIFSLYHLDTSKLNKMRIEEIL